MTGNNQQLIPANVSIKRQSNILNHPEDYIVSIENFFLMGVRLPLFKITFDYVIGIYEKSSGTIYHDNIDFTDWNEDGFIYDYDDVAAGIQKTLESVCSAQSVESIPTFSFDDKTLVFSIDSSSNFRDDYEIVFNENMVFGFNSFPLSKLDDEFYSINLKGDRETQDNKTLEFLSPVSRIVLESNNLPVNSELLPPSGSGEISNNIGVFLTDYKYFQSNNQSIQTIVFSAAESDHRYHNLNESNTFNQFNLNFVWYDYDGNKYQVFLFSELSKAGIKIMFKSI